MRANVIASIVAFFSDAERPRPGLLPQRVQRLIAIEEANSERLIGWVQLLLVGLFLALYLVAPRPADAPASMVLEPVPLALLAYAVFTLARLRLAYIGRLPGSLLFASILADVGLLVGLIWSFHVHYDQAPAFSLKVPTFVYLFVFISVRALRFDHRYVLVAGVAAAAAWLLMLAAILITSGPAVVTRSFTAHLNGNKVLLGAEIDKVLALLLVTSVLAFAVYRGRRLFVTAIRDEVALADLSRFFGKGVSATVVDAETQAVAGTAIERDAAILMLDIRGFTALTEGSSPRRVIEVLTGLHARVIPLVRANGGVIDKFLGDGIMATFGAVTTSDTPAANALRALEAVMQEGRAWQRELADAAPGDMPRVPFELHGAVTAGPVLFAVVGAGDRLEYTVIGSAVNLAAKLEKHNKAEGTRALTTVATFEAALEQGFEPRGAIRRIIDQHVQGVGNRIDLVALAE